MITRRSLLSYLGSLPGLFLVPTIARRLGGRSEVPKPVEVPSEHLRDSTVETE